MLQRLNLNERVIEPMLHNLAIVLVILVPAITMRSFAEEKRTGTYELLLTAPIRTGEIVAGKFIAAAAFMLIMIGLAGMFPLILVAFGNPEVGVMFSGLLLGAMRAGAQTMQIQAGVPPELVDALQAIILVLLVINVLRRWLGRRSEGQRSAPAATVGLAQAAEGGA